MSRSAHEVRDARLTFATDGAPPEPVTAKLSCAGLRKSYGDRLVVDVDHLEVSAGETLAILGPNGAGKSTLFRQLALLESPDEGTVYLDGRPVGRGDLDARRRMASVFQRALLFQGSVADNVAYGLRLRRTPRREIPDRVERGLELVGLEAFRDAAVRGLSGGELQRVALARALVLEPEILFLDEPTSSLDPAVRQRFRTDLRDLIRRVDATVVLITHDQSEAMLLADRVVVLRQGTIAQVGPPREVFTHPSDAFVAEFMGVETLWEGNVHDTSWGIMQIETDGGLMVEAVGESPVGSRAVLALRAEDVLLSLGDEPEGAARHWSARNSWGATVSRVELLGAVMRVHLDVETGDDEGPGGGHGESLVALVTRRSGEELGLEPGTRVDAAVKATAVHAIPLPGDGFGGGVHA